VVECVPCLVFASFTLAFALQLRKKQGKTSVRVRKPSVRLRKTSVTVQYTYYQKHPHITKPSQTHTLQNPLIHTLQNNIKPPQYKLKRNAHRKSKLLSDCYMIIVGHFQLVECWVSEEIFLVFLPWGA
jgi:hypothetical protein